MYVSMFLPARVNTVCPTLNSPQALRHNCANISHVALGPRQQLIHVYYIINNNVQLRYKLYIVLFPL